MVNNEDRCGDNVAVEINADGGDDEASRSVFLNHFLLSPSAQSPSLFFFDSSLFLKAAERRGGVIRFCHRSVMCCFRACSAVPKRSRPIGWSR